MGSAPFCVLRGRVFGDAAFRMIDAPREASGGRGWLCGQAQAERYPGNHPGDPLPWKSPRRPTLLEISLETRSLRSRPSRVSGFILNTFGGACGAI